MVAWLRRRFWRELRALQVEVTSRCTRRCAVCPRGALAQRWVDGDLAPESWQRIVPALSRAQHVHLQGWGEPLLHPRLRTMVQDCKGRGCTVGITTNADLLERATDWVVEDDVDIVTVSVAGHEAHHRLLRDGSELSTIQRAVTALVDCCRSRRASTRVQVSYLLTMENARALPDTVTWAAAAGVDELFVVHLDAPSTAEVARLAAFTHEGLAEGVQTFLDEAAERARKHGLSYREPPEGSRDVLVCELDPTRMAFVGWDGRVAPCVHLLLPVRGPLSRWFGNKHYAIEAVSFGRLADRELNDLLSGPERRAFTASFVDRQQAERRFRSSMPAEIGSEALRMLDEADHVRAAALQAAPFPPACAGCPKQVGW